MLMARLVPVSTGVEGIIQPRTHTPLLSKDEGKSAISWSGIHAVLLERLFNPIEHTKQMEPGQIRSHLLYFLLPLLYFFFLLCGLEQKRHFF